MNKIAIKYCLGTLLFISMDLGIVRGITGSLFVLQKPFPCHFHNYFNTFVGRRFCGWGVPRLSGSILKGLDP